MAHEPYCKTLRPWLKGNLGPKCLAPLTSADSLALDAAVQIVALWSLTGNRELPNAFGAVVRTMQQHTQYLAYHSIAHVADWHVRSQLWHLSGLPDLGRFPGCKNAPRPEEVRTA